MKSHVQCLGFSRRGGARDGFVVSVEVEMHNSCSCTSLIPFFHHALFDMSKQASKTHVSRSRRYQPSALLIEPKRDPREKSSRTVGGFGVYLRAEGRRKSELEHWNGIGIANTYSYSRFRPRMDFRLQSRFVS